MATATKPRPVLSDEALAQLLPLLKDANSVELKLTIPESDQFAAASALDIDPLDAQIRQVFFFDTPDLDLNKAGVVVRARRIQQKAGDSVVKLRPVVPDHLSKELRKSPNFSVEVDAMPGGYVCSGSLKAVLGTTDVREAIKGDRPIRKLFSKEQRAFYATHAPTGLELDELSIFGPVFVLKLRFSPAGFARRLVAEAWMYPDNSRIIELSTKCLPAEAFQAAAESRLFLVNRGVELSGEQQTKTKKALEYFSERLKEVAGKQTATQTKSSNGRARRTEA
jgi:hypothetical protein